MSDASHPLSQSIVTDDGQSAVLIETDSELNDSTTLQEEDEDRNLEEERSEDGIGSWRRAIRRMPSAEKLEWTVSFQTMLL